jgi:hypothetical protein
MTTEPQPHAANTEDTWRAQKTILNSKMAPFMASKDDVEMQDRTWAPPKATGGYHFTSTVQDMVNGDAVQSRILKTMVMLPLKDIIGISADLQKQFTGLTKTRCEYTTKTVVVELVTDTSCEEETAYIESFNDYQDENSYYKDKDGIPEYSTVHLSYCEEEENLDDVLLQYSAAVKVVASPLFATTTGRSNSNLAGEDVTFMVDSGSKLNLISEDLHN